VPNNFDGKFLGLITLRKALALSRNIVSVRLIEKSGRPWSSRWRTRPAFVPIWIGAFAWFGSSVVSPLEMTSAFSTFANGGIYVTPYTVDRVEDSSGRQLEGHIPIEKEAMSPQLAYLTTNVLKAS